MRSRMSVLDIVFESDAYSRLPIAACGTWRAPVTREKVEYGERPLPRHETRALNHLGFPSFVRLRIFAFKLARCVRSIVPVVDDLPRA
jgi:hypothetical protein